MTFDSVVIGGGIAGLSSAIWLAQGGQRVALLERAADLGGKAGTMVSDGIEVDTGPSVLTLPHVFDDMFAAAGLNFREMVRLTRPSPAFRYHYDDGATLDVFHDLKATLTSVQRSLGSRAEADLAAYLAQAARIWEAAAPHFVYDKAPSLTSLLFGGPRTLLAATRIDAMRKLGRAIDAQVTSPHLRMLLRRYATYNGSDARRAPATLGCIAHVELSLGGYGIQGGMIELVRALKTAAEHLGVMIQTEAEVLQILTEDERVTGVKLESGETLKAPQVVSATEVAHLAKDLLQGQSPLPQATELSMSAHTGVIRARRQQVPRPAHSVLFPANYDAEFRDIFDRRRVPESPTVYLCAQEACHGRPGWASEEPVFVMVNAPALGPVPLPEAAESAKEIEERLRARCSDHGLLSSGDRTVWWRTPADLAARFPGSFGALYGAASNDTFSAFQRPKNRSSRPRGLYLASGTAHPGGGVPLVALSGRQAALAALNDRKNS